MCNPIAPFAVQRGEGQVLKTPTGDSVTIKADTMSTNGSLTILELSIGPRAGPPLHTHLREDEVWYVLDGDFRFKTGDTILRVSTGGMAFGPRGTPHNVQNLSHTTGRLLVIASPSGLERFFEQCAALLPGPVGPAALAAVGHLTGLTSSVHRSAFPIRSLASDRDRRVRYADHRHPGGRRVSASQSSEDPRHRSTKECLVLLRATRSRPLA